MHRGPCGPRNITVDALYWLAIDPQALRFSFVRNPYARAVSCWADKFAGKPLIGGDFFVDAYLAARLEIDPALPAGEDRTLSFPEFVRFAAATARTRHDMHLQAQDDILNMPGIILDLIGKVETFDADFAFVLDHLNAVTPSAAKRPSPLMNRIMTTGQVITRLNWPTSSIAPTNAISTASVTRARSGQPRPPSEQRKRGRRRQRPRGFRLLPLQAGPDSFTFFSGSERTRLPVAAKIALVTAGAIGAVPGSPMPPHFLPPESAR